MFPDFFKTSCEQVLTEEFGRYIAVKGVDNVGGGCINEAVKIKTDAGDFFLKWNDADRYPEMFEKEAKGLQVLYDAQSIKIPEIVLCHTVESVSYLVLEFIKSGNRKTDFWRVFGESLANLHMNTHKSFGLDYDNYIGSLVQRNKQHNEWNTFFVEERLERQILLAMDSGKINTSHVKRFQNLYKYLPEIFPEEKPALLHGDLWSGNFMVDAGGSACLIDPAVYYGHREADLAFTQLFGGFDTEFYSAYDNILSLEKGFSQRADIYNLYPLMVHVNLLGGGYLHTVETILKKF